MSQAYDINLITNTINLSAGTVDSWLLHLSLDWVIQVRALAEDIICRILGQDSSLSQLRSTQMSKWAPGKFNAGGNPVMD